MKRPSHGYKRRKPKFIIHVTIRSPSRKSCTSSIRSVNKQQDVSLSRSTQLIEIDRSVNRSSQVSSKITAQKEIHSLSRSSKVVPFDNKSGSNHYSSKIYIIQSKETGNTKDYHRNVKKNKTQICTPARIIICVIALVVVLGIITTTIALLLLKQPQTTTISPRTVQLRWNKTGFVIAGISGVPGNQSDQLNTPFDAVVDYAYSLYVLDRNNSRVQKFTRGSTNGVTVAGDGTIGSGATQFWSPTKLSVDWNGDIRVADYANHRVQLWKNGASSGITIAGIAANQFEHPCGIAHDIASDTLYVCEISGNRVMQYLSGASSGTVIAGGNVPGKNVTQLSEPVAVYFDSFTRSLLIVNSNIHDIVRWPLGASNWTLVAGDSNGNYGSNSTMLRWPSDVTLDPMGNMYIADKNNYRIQLFMNGQMDGITVASVSSLGSIPNSTYGLPFSIALDNQLNLYVSDAFNHRIQKFLRY